MRDNLPLDAYLEEYYQGNTKKKELEGRIFTYILDHCQRYGLRNWERGECIDYLCWLYPRLSRAIDNYAYAGASFDAYIGSMIRWSSKEYRAIENDRQLTEDSCWNIQAVEMEVQSQEAGYMEAEPRAPFKAISNPRQALVLLLKSYNYVSDDFITRAAPAIGVPKETLFRLVDTLRQRLLKRDDEIYRLRERIHSQYYRCVTLEKRLSGPPPGSIRHVKLSRRLEKAQRRLAAMRRRLNFIRPDASNRLVADVLGVPKGTVDSNLYAVKARLRNNAGEFDD